MNDAEPCAADIFGEDFVLVKKTSPAEVEKDFVVMKKSAGVDKIVNLRNNSIFPSRYSWKTSAVIGGGFVVFIGVAYFLVKLKNAQQQINVHQNIIVKQQIMVENILDQNSNLLRNLTSQAENLSDRLEWMIRFMKNHTFWLF